MIPAFTVIYDANVLYSSFLRDLLMRLALTDLYRARWSEDIHREWMENLAENRPDLVDKIPRIRALMDHNVRDCLVTGYEELIDGLHLPDPKDRHVLAAAIKTQAQEIVTYNLRDFPSATLARYGLEAQHPDAFVLCQLDLHREKVLSELETHRSELKQPPLTPDEYCNMVQRQRMPETAAFLRQTWSC